MFSCYHNSPPHLLFSSCFFSSYLVSTGITVDKNGLIYFVDGTTIRKVDQNGIISTFLGSNDLTSARPLTCDNSMDINQVTYTHTSAPQLLNLRVCLHRECHRDTLCSYASNLFPVGSPMTHHWYAVLYKWIRTVLHMQDLSFHGMMMFLGQLNFELQQDMQSF